ncbi:MAG: hypothetical protein ABEJ87_01155 [Candidatus Nanohalobium sp.]
MGENALPGRQDMINFLAASALLGISFTAFSGRFTLERLVLYLVAGLIVMFLREGGQRTVAHWMDSYVELNVSREGAFLTLMAAVFSVVANTPFLLLFPIYTEFSGKSYEQWGKEIDAMWMKRKYWLSSAGIIGLWLGWGLAYLWSLNIIAQAISLFTIFQLLPLDYEKIPAGPLDGATILRWSGFTWLMMMGFSILMYVFVI